MISLLLAIGCSALLSIIMRLSTDRVSNNVGMLAMNYLMCLAVASAYTGLGNLFPAGPELPGTLGMGAAQGVLYLLSFSLLQVNVKRNGVVLSATFKNLGLLVPMVVSIVLFGEIPGPMQVLGFAIAVGAILLINLEKDQSVMEFKAGLIFLLLAGGGGDAMAKVFDEWGSPERSAQFLLYTFLVALVLCLALMVKKGQRPGKAEVFFGFVIGVPNYFCTKFLLRALEEVPAVIVYPTFSVGTLLVVTLTGVLLFKERLGKRQQLAIGIILAALVLLNL